MTTRFFVRPAPLGRRAASEGPCVAPGALIVDHRQVLRALAVALGFGLTAALLAAGGTLGGRWLDARTHTTPLFSILGLLAGLGAGFAMFVREVARVLGDGARR